ncbi:MAG: preprotein translocase subunit SecG [Muribaculaceae bacterium]|nr:preprotein translocase subunit SecG [Muribaculaceae bacterium]
MQTALIIISVIISVLLIIVVLIQKSKGGGLASNFAGSNQIMGVRRTNNFIEKATWTLAIIVCFLSLMSGILMRGGVQDNQPMVKDVAPIEQFPGTFETPEQNAAEGEAVAAEEVVVDEAAPAEATEAPAPAEAE